MPTNSLLVLAVDGLRASALGPYGNTTYPTPAFDRLASEGVVYDRYFVESSDLGQVMDALWTGRHPCNRNEVISQPVLPAAVKSQGGRCWVVTDEIALASHPVADQWDEIVLVDHPLMASPAEDPLETSIGHVLASALEVAQDLSARKEPCLLWVHLRGMEASWDAPTEFSLELRDDDEDPTWEPTIEIPRYTLEAGDGDDPLFTSSCRYAGQVMALDHCVGAFLTEFDSDPRWDVLAMGIRGFALGEHGVVGKPLPYKEQFHVPLCYRTAGRQHRLTRVGDLIQPNDLSTWLGQFISREFLPRSRRPVAISWSNDRFAFTTESWSAVDPVSGDDSAKLELYVEPDDRWQGNNVASRCESEVDEFAELSERVNEGRPWDDLFPRESIASSAAP